MTLSNQKLHAVMSAFGQLPKKAADGYQQHIALTKTNVVCDCGVGRIDVRGHRNASLETNPVSAPAAAIYSVSYECDSKDCDVADQNKTWTMPS